ncbi:MAG: hypothetical protein PVG49_05710 [Desulfobacteraceae bacterium]|jgi:general secretion pathway protein D
MVLIGVLAFFAFGCASGVPVKPRDPGRPEALPAVAPREKRPVVTVKEPVVKHQGDEAASLKDPSTRTETFEAEKTDSRAPATRAPASVPPAPPQPEMDEETIGSLDFRDEKLPNILKVVSAVMGVNVLADKDLEEDEITIYLQDVSPRAALEALCKQGGYWYEEGDGYIRVTSVKKSGRIVMAPDGTIQRLMFNEIKLPRALMMLSERTGRNVVCRDGALDKEINILMSNVSLKTAIELICKRYNLWYRHDPEDDSFVLMKAAEFGNDMVMDFRPKTRVFNLKYASAPQLAESLALAMGKRVEYTPPTVIRTYEHLKTEKFDDDEPTIQTAKSETNLAENVAGPKINEDSVTAGKLEALVRNKLELMLTDEELRRINQEVGVALVSLFMRNNAIIVCSTDQALVREIGELIAQLDTPTPQVLIETKILSVNLTDDFSSFFDITFNESDGEGTFSWTSTFAPFTAVGTATYNFVDAIDGYDINTTMRLLKDNGMVNVVASPLLVAAQNAEAKAFIGINDYPIVTNIDVETNQDDEGNITQIILKPEVSKVEVGTELIMTPQINEDGSVTLRLFIKQSNISATRPVIPYYDGVAEVLRDYEVNVVEEDRIDTIITVPPGKTLALGGLVNEEDSVTESKVPFLGDLPLVGFFFKEHETVKERTETVFLITPHIIMAPAEVTDASEKALEGLEHPIIKHNKRRLLEFNKETKGLRRN